MTEIEKKALALVTQLQEEDDGKKYSYAYHFEALCRAIEQHEAFRQEVSDAVESLCNTTFAHERYIGMRDMLRRRFVISKPDPLVDALYEAFPISFADTPMLPDDMGNFREALAKRGLKIVEDTDAPR